MTIEGRIVELFERHREAPGKPYDETRFLDFLLAEPAGQGQLHNSFRGLRRLNAFIEDVQLEFAVCFSLKDRGSNYSVNQFADRVAKLQQSPRGSMQSLRSQSDAGSGIVGPAILADFALLIVGYAVSDIPWARLIVVILAVFANAYFAWFAWNARRYLYALKYRIEALAS